MITNTTQLQIGKPKKNVVAFFFFSTGFGSSAWQRQQKVLSSGFQVLHFRQSILWFPLP